MSSRARVPTALIISVLVTASLPGPAAGDGLPAGVDATPVSAPGGEVEYTTKSLRRGTLVLARGRSSGRLLRNTRLRGSWSVPAVAYDGSASGLSADGRTLVLISPRRRFPRIQTSFVILDPGRLRARRVLRLRGDFSFDALSPDGSLMYLINYLSRRDRTRYRVRAYDLPHRRLLPKPIVDPREPPDELNGIPITRESSPDGRWSYTLYDGAEHPFVHALDTKRRRAVCVDLHGLDERRNGVVGVELDVARDGSTLRVEASGRALASIDTTSFVVTERTERAKEARSASRRTGTPWLLLSVAAFALVLATVLRLVGKPVSPAQT